MGERISYKTECEKLKRQLAKQKTEFDKCKRELGITEQRMKSFEKQLDVEKAKGEAYQQLQDINLAMITAIVRDYGEVKISQARINETLEKGIQTAANYDHDTGEYVLRVAE